MLDTFFGGSDHFIAVAVDECLFDSSNDRLSAFAFL